MDASGTASARRSTPIVVVVVATVARGRRAAEASVDRSLAVGRGARLAARRARGAHRAGEGARVLALGVLGAARVLGAAVGGAGGVGAAVGGALVAPLLADVEGHGLGVLGDVGRVAVGADAAVGQGGGVAGVAIRCGAVGFGLEADAGGGCQW